MYLINEDRFIADIEALGKIGENSSGGVDRPALSPAHLRARSWLQNRVEQAGLKFRRDGAANHFAVLECGRRHALTFLMGSHTDSVPNGGRYDGALGVVAGLEVLRCVKELGLVLPVNLGMVDFTDEEGTLLALFGSHAFAGLIDVDALDHPRSGREALFAGMQRAGITMESILDARCDPSSLAGYLELHIEQGRHLERSQIQIGVVTGITGIAAFRLHFLGRADHAGTCEMADRLDAGQGASAFTLAARQLVMEQYPQCVANVGQVQYSPGVFNIVPERAILSFECRSADPDEFSDLESDLTALARQQAERYSLQLELELIGRHQPVMMDKKLCGAIHSACSQLGLSSIELPSRAGHDAQMVASLCPAGMIFVPSEKGASHSPREFTSNEDCIQGANVLFNAAIEAVHELYP